MEVYMYVFVFFVNHSIPFFSHMLVFSVENHNTFNYWSLKKKGPLIYRFHFFFPLSVMKQRKRRKKIVFCINKMYSEGKVFATLPINLCLVLSLGVCFSSEFLRPCYHNIWIHVHLVTHLFSFPCYVLKQYHWRAECRDWNSCQLSGGGATDLLREMGLMYVCFFFSHYVRNQHNWILELGNSDECL